MAVREAEPVGSFQEMKEVGLDREDLLAMYRSMLVTRGLEERGHILYKQGKIPGSFYTGRGNEAASVGVATAMGPRWCESSGMARTRTDAPDRAVSAASVGAAVKRPRAIVCNNPYGRCSARSPAA